MVGDHIGEGLNLPVTASAGHETVMGGLLESPLGRLPCQNVIRLRRDCSSNRPVGDDQLSRLQGRKDQFVRGVSHCGSPHHLTISLQGTANYE
jgi:hypothetical protein